MAGKFINLILEITISKSSTSMNAKKSCGSRYKILKILKEKEKILKEERKQQLVTCNGTKLRLISDLLK